MALLLRDAVRQVIVLTVAHFGLLLLLSTGTVMPPEQKSLLPPSFCLAPPTFYQQIGVLNFFFAPTAMGAVCLAGFVSYHCQLPVAGVGAGAAGKATLRALTLMAVALSATAAGLATTSSILMLQVKAGKLVCQSGAVRVSVYASYLVIGPVLALCYIDLARIALLSE